jgi:hypothetical protein
VKTAIYIEDGVTQLVLTPETQFEKDACGTLFDKPLQAKIYEGSFYECHGGWTRQFTGDKSIIFRVSSPQPSQNVAET